MDPILKPIKSVLDGGLQVITVNTGRPGTISGGLSINAGSDHMSAINPELRGLTHFREHIGINGASRNYRAGEIKRIMEDDYFSPINAATGRSSTKYFISGLNPNIQGLTLPRENFWGAFATVADGIFFPRFDAATIDRERSVILNEIKQTEPPWRTRLREYDATIYGIDTLRLSSAGTAEQVASYTWDQLEWLQKTAYVKEHTVITLAGDISHNEAIERLGDILKSVPNHGSPLPQINKATVQRGEHYLFKDLNAGQIDCSIHFPAATLADSNFGATRLAVKGLSDLVEEALIEKYGLYSPHIAYLGWNESNAQAILKISSPKNVAPEAIKDSLEIISSPATAAHIANRHANLIGRTAHDVRVDEPSSAELVGRLLAEAEINGPFRSPSEEIARLGTTKKDEVAQVITDLSKSPCFLTVSGPENHANSLLSIDAIDQWRGFSPPPAPSQLAPAAPVRDGNMAQRALSALAAKFPKFLR